MTMLRLVAVAVVTAACLVESSPVVSQQHEAAVEKEKPCSAPEYRQFDFWIGEWTVTANGEVAGTNRVSLILDGCVVMEEWVGGKGLEGKSFNRYDADDGRWRQVWVDNRGRVLDLAGGYRDGKMILEGESLRGGKTVRNRITWHNNISDGTVRQVWEVSGDGGQTWSTVFDGLYEKR